MLVDDDTRIGRLNRAYAKMLNYRSSLLHEAVKLGYPRFVDELVDTACVGESDDGRVVYYWNRAFFDNKKGIDLTYICAHETLHLVLGHPLRTGDRDKHRWNVACDIMVNALLDYQFGQRCSDALDNRWLPDHVGMTYNEVLEMTTEELYDALPPQIKTIGMDLGSHEFWESLSEEQIEKVHAAIEKHMKKAGQGSRRELIALKKLLIKQFPWQRLLRARLASVKKPQESESWVRANRKIYANYPKVLLPGAHDGDDATSSILSSIDTSGSMSEDSITDMVAIMMSLPRDRYETRTTWFDDGVYAAPDLTQVKGRGGTSFQKIEDVCTGTIPIKGKNDEDVFLTRYPDVVVVMTDGWAPDPVLRYPSRWIWVVAAHGSCQLEKLGCTVWKLTR